MDGFFANYIGNPKIWLNNTKLDFFGTYSITTGEIKEEKYCALYKGLYFSIVNGKEGVYYNLRGSLPKFYNNGENNFIEYNYKDFLKSLIVLEDELKISPREVIFKNIEFPVTICAPVKSIKLIESLKYHKGANFEKIFIKNKYAGIKVIHQQYHLKIYDKGLQMHDKISNIIKIELVVKKMIFVKHLGLKTLEDLKNINVWVGLYILLIKAWNDFIFIDRNIDYNKMRNLEQKKFLEFENKSFWNSEEGNYLALNYYENLLLKYQKKPNVKSVINNLIVEKCIENVTEKDAKIIGQLTEFIKPIYKRFDSNNLLPINLYDKGLIDKQKHSQLQVKKGGGEIAHKKTAKCKCRDCRKSLRNKKSNALYCSNACRQKFHNHKKKAQIKNERAILESVVNKKTNLNLLLGLKYYNEKSGNFDYLKGDEVMIANEVIKSLKEVLLIRKPSEKPQRLTHARARGLVRYLSGRNRECILGL